MQNTDYIFVLNVSIRLFLYLFPDFRVSHFLPHLFREIFANTKLSIKFRIKFEYEKNFVSSFAKQENPEIISFRKALLYTTPLSPYPTHTHTHTRYTHKTYKVCHLD